jgi:hypothetical protein
MSSKKPKHVGDTYIRHLANKSHTTYQSHLETEKKGWMKQWIVNTVLGQYGDS